MKQIEVGRTVRSSSASSGRGFQNGGRFGREVDTIYKERERERERGRESILGYIGIQISGQPMYCNFCELPCGCGVETNEINK